MGERKRRRGRAALPNFGGHLERTEIVSGATIDPGLMLAILSAMVLSGTRWADALSPRKRRSASKKRRHRSRRRSEKPEAVPV